MAAPRWRKTSAKIAQVSAKSQARPGFLPGNPTGNCSPLPTATDLYRQSPATCSSLRAWPIEILFANLQAPDTVEGPYSIYNYTPRTHTMQHRPIPLEDFFRNSERTGYQLSPDARHISYLAPWHDRLNLFVRPIDRPDAEAVRLTSETERSLAG